MNPPQMAKKVKNTSLWIDEAGQISQRYQKVHLFDVEIEGGPVLKESNGVEKGMEILPPFETKIGRVGLMICFDVSYFLLLFPRFHLCLGYDGLGSICSLGLNSLPAPFP